jgi:hypothetical protein
VPYNDTFSAGICFQVVTDWPFFASLLYNFTLKQYLTLSVCTGPLKENIHKAGGDMQRLGRHKWLMVCTLFIVGVLPLFIGGCGSKQNSPVYNITGNWFMFYATKGTAGEVGPSQFTFTTTDNNITGLTDKGQVITGEVAGLDITFSFVDSDGALNTSTGTVAASDGSTMSGTWTKSNGQSGTWHAVIGTVSPQADATGNWNMFQTTSGGSEQGLGLFTFSQSGFGIAGTTSDGKSIIGATGRLDITFFWVDADGVTHTLTGIITADGSSMSGTWYDTAGKSGTWRATRS